MNEVYFDSTDVREIVESFINGNRNDAVKKMKEIKDLWQEEEFMDILDEFDGHRTEILVYFFKNS